MEARALAIPDIKILTLRKFRDERGFFAETYNKQALGAVGIDIDFVQDNHSLSARPGTIRGLHFQAPPFAQDKLVRVARGRIFDVALDIRHGSPTFGQAVCVVIGAEDGQQVFVPKGFAHGFCTLEPDTEVLYKVSDYYSPRHDRGIVWNDPDIDIAWPVAEAETTLSEKDRVLPRLKELPKIFVWERP